MKKFLCFRPATNFGTLRRMPTYSSLRKNSIFESDLKSTLKEKLATPILRRKFVTPKFKRKSKVSDFDNSMSSSSSSLRATLKRKLSTPNLRRKFQKSKLQKSIEDEENSGLDATIIAPEFEVQEYTRAEILQRARDASQRRRERISYFQKNYIFPPVLAQD